MKASRFCMLMFCLLALLCPPLVRAADIAEEQVTSPVLQKALDSLRANKKEEALRIIAGFRPDGATLAQYYFASGRVMKAMGDPLEAAGRFRKAYLYAPQGDMKELAMLERAETYLGMGYFYEARSVYLVFLRNFPQSRFLSRLYPGLARSLSGTGDFREAVSYYEKAGDSPGMLIGKANSLHHLGLYQEADRIYAEALKTSEPLLAASDESLFCFGENLRQLGRLPEAAKYLSAVKGQPFKSRASLGLGSIAMQQDREAEAMKLFDTALATGERETRKQALLFMAEIAMKQGKTREARTRLEELRSRYPYGRTYEEGLLLLSRVFVKEGETDKAVLLLTQISFSPSFRKEALDELQNIVSQAKAGDKDRFVNLWQTAGRLLLDVSREEFLLDVADGLRSSGGPFLDIVQYLAKHGTEKGKMKSLTVLAGYYAEKGDTAGTEDCLARLKAMKGSGEELLRIEARLAWLKKEYKTAAERFLRLKTLQTGDLKLLGDIVAADPSQAKALARYEKAVKETGGDAPAYTRLADIMYDRGKSGEALSYYRIALEKEPGKAWPLYRIGVLTEGQEAEEALRKVGKEDPVITKLTEARLRELDLAKKGIGNF